MSATDTTRVELIRKRIKSAFGPSEINIVDQSHLHAGHIGALESGGGHYQLEVVSILFTDKSLLERHRMIYEALGDAMGTVIHALSINAQTPSEMESNSTRQQA